MLGTYMGGIGAHLARLCLGATVVGWFVWRRNAGKREKDPFQAVLAYASNEELIRLHANYEALVALEVNPSFVYKLDVCAAEMRKRGLSRAPATPAEAKTEVNANETRTPIKG
jgi:hypothetical protein